MTAIEMEAGRPERLTLNLTIAMPGFVSAFIRRRRQRRLYAELARLPDHIIRDIGFDPDEIHDAVQGTWDDLNPLRHVRR